MAGKRSRIPKYGTVEIKGHTYYRTTITDSEGKQRTLYAKTCEELYDKELDALSQLDDDRQRRKSPTVADYCEKWLVMQSAHVRTTTLTDYTSKVRRNIIPYLGEKKIADVTLDDIQLALVPVSKKSASVYKSVHFPGSRGKPDHQKESHGVPVPKGRRRTAGGKTAFDRRASTAAVGCGS